MTYQPTNPSIQQLHCQHITGTCPAPARPYPSGVGASFFCDTHAPDFLYDQLSDLGNQREHGLGDAEYYPRLKQLNRHLEELENDDCDCDCAGPNDRPGCPVCAQAAAEVYDIEEVF